MPREPQHLRSQQLRAVNHQGDALRLGMNWTEEDLAKPQVLVDSADGMGHPGTFHFRSLIEEVSNGVFEAGGKPGVFTVSDICDGVVQATSGMSYSLVSRDIMAAMVEIHALGHPHDGMVLISGNDKSVPAHLVAIARCNLPAIHLPGGTQLNAPDYVTSNKMWPMGAAVERGEIPREDLELAQRGACPTCGACQFMGSASTGQVLAEALGLALPGSALTPAPLTKLLRSETKNLIDEVQLHRMKPSAFLINIARGPIVNDTALYRALKEGWIAGAGLDDIEEEPAKQRDWKPTNPLFGLDNVIITSHAAYYSEEAIRTVRDFAAQEVVRVLTGQEPLSPVNAVQLANVSPTRST